MRTSQRLHIDGRNVKVQKQYKVQQARHKREKGKSSAGTNSHKSDKQHKPDKCQPLPRVPRYERYTPLTTNWATIFEEAFNAEIPIQLPPTPHPRLGLNITKHCKYPHNHDHNTEDCWTLKDKIEELTHVGYPTQFVKKLDDNRTRGKYEGHHEDYPKHKCWWK